MMICTGGVQATQQAIAEPIVSSDTLAPLVTKALVTMYSSVETCPESCVMANGRAPKEGDAACPRAIPLGTQIEIDGVPYTCSDRTARKYDGRYDIFAGYGMTGYNIAKKWGKQIKEVTITK